LIPFSDSLANAIRQQKTPVLVGLDPRFDQLPQSLVSSIGNAGMSREEHAATAYREYCFGIIDVVAPLVPAVKPQAAFFEELGPAGMLVLAQVIRYAQEKGLLVILDGKRNDIGSTATAYANGILGRKSPWGADALTVSPYLGDDSITPFVEVARRENAGIFVLVKTSNSGGKTFQDLVVTADGQPLYRHVASHVESLATQTVGECGYGAVGAVVGATYPAQLAELRAQMPHTWFLVPGYGAQGGTARDVASAFDVRGMGAIVNNSRGIIQAYRNKPYAERFGESRWQEAIEAATCDMIDQLRSDTPAGCIAGA